MVVDGLSSMRPCLKEPKATKQIKLSDQLSSCRLPSYRTKEQDVQQKHLK